MITEFLLSLICVLLGVQLYTTLKKKPSKKEEVVIDTGQKRKAAFVNYPVLLAVLEYSKKYAYDRIFEKHILVNSRSGIKLTGHEAKQCADEYVKLTFKHCGPDIINDLTLVHGNLEAICLILVSEFMQRLIDDEVIMIDKFVNQEMSKERNKKELPDRVARIYGGSK